MKFLALILLSIITYAIPRAFFSRALHVEPDSAWYLLCFLLSGSVLASGQFWGLRSANISLLFASVAVVVSVIVVAAGDLLAAVWFSCSEGVCM